MALLWMDGFDHYSQAQSGRMYDDGVASSMSTTIFRTGTQSMRPHYNDPGTCKYLGVNAPVLICGLAFYYDQESYHNTAWVPVVLFRDGTTVQCSVDLGPSGRIRVYTNTTVAQSADASYPLKSWAYLEVKITFGNPGSYEVRINGRTVLSGTARTTTTSNNYANWVGHKSASVIPVYIDDLYICDNTGTTNNDFLGDIKVVTILPNNEGSLLEWSTSSGSTHYALVDETPANDDTDYVHTNTVGATETLNFQDITLTGSIRGILQLACIRKDDAGAREAALICRVGTTNYEGPQQPVGNTYTYLKQLRETNPDTGAPWTVAEINAAQFGVRMKA